MAKDEVSRELLAELGNAIRGGEPLPGGLPTGMQLLQTVLPKPKEAEKPKEEAPREDPKLAEARADEKAAKEELAAMGDRLKYLESGARLLARKRGVDWDAIDTAPAETKVMADARKRADAVLQGRMRDIATQRLLAGKRELGLEELQARARKEIAKGTR